MRLDPFIVVLLLTVLVASFLPARGAAGDALNLASTIAITSLFFFHGIRLPRENVTAALRHWRLHLTILSITFVAFPLLGFALASLWPQLLPGAVWTGVLFLCALPSTVQSSIAYTSIAHGNVAGSVTSAAASSMLGIVLSPLIASALLHSHAEAAPSLDGIWKVLLQLLLPFVLGHLSRPWLADWGARNKVLLSFTDRGTIVVTCYASFSATAIAGIWHQIPPATLGVLLIVCAALLTIALLLTRFGARALGFKRPDEISIVFCGSKKSLVAGVPIARVMFSPADAGVVILPLMLFHQIQLIVCAWLAQRYAERQVEENLVDEMR